jgi:hypothetical protein
MAPILVLCLTAGWFVNEKWVELFEEDCLDEEEEEEEE